MLKLSEPTTPQNAVFRLFWRFFLCYLLSACIGIVLSIQGLFFVSADRFASTQLIFLLLSRLGAILTISKPFLWILTASKAVYDVSAVYRFTVLTQAGAITILSWNALFLLIVFTAIVFLCSVALSEWFVFLHRQRNLQLILSKDFGLYAIQTLFFTAIALSLYALWPRLCSFCGLSSAFFAHLPKG